VAGMDNVSEVDVEVGLMDWEADVSAMEVMAAVKAVVVLVGGDIGEAVVVAEVEGLI
ncbi:hypothetical protein KI387_038521, partial [Taxus chinensis]